MQDDRRTVSIKGTSGTIRAINVGTAANKKWVGLFSPQGSNEVWTPEGTVYACEYEYRREIRLQAYKEMGLKKKAMKATPGLLKQRVAAGHEATEEDMKRYMIA